MKRILLILFLMRVLLVPQPLKAAESAPRVYLTGVPYALADSLNPAALMLEKEGKEIPINQNTLLFKSAGRYSLKQGSKIIARYQVIPGWLSLLPPLLAIILALITRQVLLSLLAGVWLGATFLWQMNPFAGFLKALTDYITLAPADADHMAIIVFSLVLGGMVGVISRSGGTAGIVQQLARYASNRQKGQLVTWLMGVFIFFDDYANTLIVGNTMRPLTDRLKISREKLSYLVDSTAAPVANIAIISTWIGYELSLIDDAFKTIGLNDNAYITFFKTIPYNFYPIFTLLFGLFIALSGRDLFSMWRAEKRASKGLVLDKNATPLADLNSGELQAKKGIPLRWYNAFIPIMVVIISTLVGLWFTGWQKFSPAQLEGLSGIRYVSTVIGEADSFAVLTWSAFFGSITAIILAIGQRILTLNQAINAWVSGIKAMVMAALILTMAWSISAICKDLQTASFVVQISHTFLSPHWLPALTFLMAGVIAFSTGTSWGTMAILAPIVIPLSYQLPLQALPMQPQVATEIFLSSIAAILAGATFGDHCSPISDTTIMSSMASGADHVDHVRTQLPYALTVAGVSLIFGYIPVGFGWHDAWIITAGVIVLWLIVRYGGKRV